MANIITEDMIEKAAIELLTSQYSLYTHIDGYTRDAETLPDNSGRGDKKQVVLPDVLLHQLIALNPDIPKDVIEREAEILCRNTRGDPLSDNYANYQKIRNGITVKFKENEREVHKILKLMDFDAPQNNQFTVASQMWIKGDHSWRRPDIIIFINGLPVVFIELKNSNITVQNAYDKNLTDYRKDIPFLFNFNQICVLSNGMETRVGSFSSGYEHFFEWLKIDDENENPDRAAIKENCVSLEYFIRGLLKPETLLDYIENFVLFDHRKGGVIRSKIIAKNHQYHGVNSAYRAFLNRKQLAGKLGVFWHTQGSGKSYSMVMLAGKIRRKCAGNFTFLVVTDRDDLDGQIYKTFLRSGFMSDAEKCQPANSAKLREELTGNKSILFTLIHKFRYDKGKKYPVLSTRDDIIVLVDEAHRTQYVDLAENMRNGLPKAQYLAFTGTPLLGSRRLTNQWFGDYVSEYNFKDSVNDNATVPLFYSRRVPEVALKNDFLDTDFADILEEENLNDSEKNRIENNYSHEIQVLKRDERLDAVARHIAKHFPNRGFRGKAMVISVDKFTAVKMYDKVQRYWQEEIKELNRKISDTQEIIERTRLKELVDYMRRVEMAVVISAENEEDKKFQKEGLSIAEHRERMEATDENGFDIEDNFKNPDHPLSLVFVCAMWLTGFDVPSLSTLYLDKPMKGHALMQAIARANRVFPGKVNGLIVDYLNVTKHLKRALADYASDDDGATPIKNFDELLSQLLEVEVATFDFCQHNRIDLEKVIDHENDALTNLSLFEAFANTLLGNDDLKNEFIVHANTVESLYDSMRPEIFTMDYSPVRKKVILYLRDILEGKIRPNQLESAKIRVNELLDQSVHVNKDAAEFIIFDDGKEIDLSKVDTDELAGLFRKTPYKNIVIADLRQYLDEKLAKMLRINTTRMSFAERFKRIIDEYNAGGSQNDDFYKKLVAFMEELHAEEARHIKEELSEEELEIFDLLRQDKLTKDEEKTVKLAAKKLYETLREKERELFIVGWFNDPKPKERVRAEIKTCLDSSLPKCYDSAIFTAKSDIIFDRIVDQAMMGFHLFSAGRDARADIRDNK